MLNIGCHLSASKGFANMGVESLKIKANTFQFFTRNPRGGKAREILEDDVEALLQIMSKNNFAKILAHAPYTLNLCSADEKIRNFAKETMIDDLKRMEFVPGNMYNLHPGSHVGQGVYVGIKYIIDALNEILKEEQTTTVLLETMAGKGSEIGSNFSEIKQIIDGVQLKSKLGVCLDTCHINDAGYDIVNNLEGVLDEFDKIIGLEKLHAIHINDSMNQIGSHKDRHQKIGEGTIGLQAFEKIINNSFLRKLPFYLETPQDDIWGYAREIEILRNLYTGDDTACLK